MLCGFWHLFSKLSSSSSSWILSHLFSLTEMKYMPPDLESSLEWSNELLLWIHTWKSVKSSLENTTCLLFHSSKWIPLLCSTLSTRIFLKNEYIIWKNMAKSQKRSGVLLLNQMLGDHRAVILLRQSHTLIPPLHIKQRVQNNRCIKYKRQQQRCS